MEQRVQPILLEFDRLWQFIQSTVNSNSECADHIPDMRLKLEDHKKEIRQYAQALDDEYVQRMQSKDGQLMIRDRHKVASIMGVAILMAQPLPKPYIKKKAYCHLINEILSFHVAERITRQYLIAEIATNSGPKRDLNPIKKLMQKPLIMPTSRLNEPEYSVHVYKTMLDTSTCDKKIASWMPTLLWLVHVLYLLEELTRREISQGTY